MPSLLLFNKYVWKRFLTYSHSYADCGINRDRSLLRVLHLLLQRLMPNLENVYSGVQVAVMMDFTTMVEPIANIQIYEGVSLSTRMADRCCGFPAVNRFFACQCILSMKSPKDKSQTLRPQGLRFMPARFKSSKKETSNFRTSSKASFQ